MKKICLIVGLLSLGGLAQATTINAPASLVGASVLNGNNAYSWGISIAVPAGQQVDSATLTFNNITLTLANSSGTGYLYTDLLKLNTPSVNTYTDNDAPGDYFATQFSGANITSLGTKFFGSVGTTLSWSYVLSSAQLIALNGYLAAGALSIGIDPDCHYSVGGLSFTYTTAGSPQPHGTVPDSATTVYLLGVSMLGLEVLRRILAPAIKA